MHLTRRHFATTALAAAALAPAAARAESGNTILNVSFDPTASLYADFDKVFATYWASQNGGAAPTINYSHGGSGAQARAVIEGLQADVVTLGLAYDIDAIAKAGLLAADWQKRLPDNSTPYSSTIVFLVRAGNPKGIKDWGDLVKPGIQIVAPNPKTSGGARWNVLAAYAWALKHHGNSADAAKAYLKTFFAQVPVLDTGAHGSTLTFTKRNIGDVLVGWESDALLSIAQAGPGKFELVYPSLSILAEPPVAIVDKNVDKHGTRTLATAYVNYLYTPTGQDVIGRNFYRPHDPVALAKYAAQFPTISLVTIRDFGGWAKTQAEFFGNGGIYDQVTSSGL